MPIDYYPNVSESDLVSMLQTLQLRQTAGTIIETDGNGFKTLNSFGPNGASSRTEVEIRRVLYSLHLKDKATYPDPYAQRITRTRARYTFS